MDFFSKNSTYSNNITSSWNTDDGYSKFRNQSTLGDVWPARTSGVTYYHRLRLVVHSKIGDFLDCPISLVDGYFLVSTMSPHVL